MFLVFSLFSVFFVCFVSLFFVGSYLLYRCNILVFQWFKFFFSGFMFLLVGVCISFQQNSKTHSTMS